MKPIVVERCYRSTPFSSDEGRLDSKKAEAIIGEHLFANQVSAMRDKVMKSKDFKSSKHLYHT